MARKLVTASTPNATETRKRVDKLAAIGDLFDQWRPAAQVLVPVRGVRSRFIWLDAVTKIGAFPIERVVTIHGPSNEGKSAAALGLGASFLDGGGFFGLIDAELTTPITWVRTMMTEHAENPRFLALRPHTYEQAVYAARQFCNRIFELKDGGKLDPDASGVLVVDSMRKLVPKNLMDNLLKQAAGESEDDNKKRGRWAKKQKGIDGMGGRAAQVKAALNAQWLDELVPLAQKSGTSIVLIARELGDDDDSSMFSRNVTVAGGKALIYDASLVIRVYRSEVIYQGQDQARRLVGEKHAMEIRKTKIGSKDVVYPRAYFHTVVDPARFDPARDAIRLGEEFGAVEVNGSRFYYEGTFLGNGIETAVETLRNDSAMLSLIQENLRGRFVLEGTERALEGSRIVKAASSTRGKKRPRKKTT